MLQVGQVGVLVQDLVADRDQEAVVRVNCPLLTNFLFFLITGGGGGSGANLSSDGSGGYTDNAKGALGTLSRSEMDEIHRRVQDILRQAETAATDTSTRVLPDRERLALSANATTRYDGLRNSVQTAIFQLKAVLEAAEAKNRERQWLKNQLSGDIDDQRLVDGITGDGRIFRRRGTPDKKHGLLQMKPKRLMFLLDCSASMARMNASDGRLDRMAACAILIMESLQDFEYKYEYAIVGHSGTTAQLPLVDFSSHPKTKGEKALVVDKIYAHARGASSGDKSVEAAVKASVAVSTDASDADDYLVFLFSDANLGRYGISPASISRALTGDGRSQVWCCSLLLYYACRWN